MPLANSSHVIIYELKNQKGVYHLKKTTS